MHTKNVLYAKLQILFIGMFVITQILLLCRTFCDHGTTAVGTMLTGKSFQDGCL